jgi:hypothetical protein
MRGFYISSLVISLIFFIFSCYYMEEVHSARMSALYDSMSNSSNDPYSSTYSYSGYDLDDDITRQAGIIGLIFFLFYAAIEVLTFIKLKTKTMKVLTIIGISLTAIMMLWDFLMIGSPGGISFDEVGPVWLIYCIIMLAFGIVGMIHAFRKKV